MKKRTVVTGVGPVSAVGIGREEFFAGICSGESGIGPIGSDKCQGRLAATIEEFRVEDYLSSPKAYLDRASELALAAASLAITDSGIDIATLATASRGLVMGSGWGSVATMSLFFADVITKGPRLAKPFLFPHTYSNTAISLVAMEYDLNGHHLNFASGAASSTCGILAAHDLIARGEADVVFVGGYEAFSEIMFHAYDGQAQLSPCDGGEEMCLPFDRRRNGFILGEGAGMVVLEERKHALSRHAHIYGEIRGSCVMSDSSVSLNEGSKGIADAMRCAVREAEIEIPDIDYVSANANGSMILDRNEAMALQSVLEDSAQSIPVSSIKAMTGETIGAAGVLQLIAGLGSIEKQIVPPTVGLATPEEGMGLSFVSTAVRKRVRTLLMNSIDPGGSIASLAVTQSGA